MLVATTGKGLSAYLPGYIDFSDISSNFIVLYCYDWLLEWDREVKYMWSQQWSFLTWVFVISRYATLFNMILQLVPTPSYIVSSCIQYEVQAHLLIIRAIVEVRHASPSSLGHW